MILEKITVKFARGCFLECWSPKVGSFYTEDKAYVTSVMVFRGIKLSLVQIFFFYFAVCMTRLFS